MPKIVDHDARRAEIGWAVAQLIESHGIQAVSVRAVAAASDYRPSTLRHYFPNSDEMVAHALVLVRQRQQERLADKQWPDSPQAALRAAWREALPLNDQRRTDTHVWLATSVSARSQEARDILASINADLHHLCEATVQAFCPSGDHSALILSLRAFTDGLALGAIADPERFTPVAIERCLDEYLTALSQA